MEEVLFEIPAGRREDGEIVQAQIAP